MSEYHVPVLLEPIIEAFNPSEEKIFLDCTFGGGGHSRALLDKGAQVIGIDQDEDAIQNAQSLLNTYQNLQLIHDNFSHLEVIAKKYHFGTFDGILFDLGVSSWQLDTQDRGFSFNKPAQLDMRMSKEQGVMAKDLIAALGVSELTKLFQLYGGEPRAKKIAQKIVTDRTKAPITTTTQLSQLVERIYQGQRGKIHPATKVFQALRIAVNDELNVIKDVLPVAVELLKPNGLCGIISFHEGEDRIIKTYFKEQSELGRLELCTPKPIVARDEEVARNIRSRSAKLRIAKRLL